MSVDPDPSSPWHPGEQEIQRRAGTADQMKAIGARLIRNAITDQHREFFTGLNMVLLGAEDTAGRLWATTLFGPPGFVRTPAPDRMQIRANLRQADPLQESLRPDCRVGILGIDFTNRRRNRVNGIVTANRDNFLTISVQQSFGNCPKYIRRRRAIRKVAYNESRREDFASWTVESARLIEGADTFFITSAFDDGAGTSNRGMDISHRGGIPGFVTIEDEQSLCVPDYPGNQFFNTLGNLQRDPRAGLLFLDFEHGHALHLSGRIEILWRGATPWLFGGAERAIRFKLMQGCIIRNTLPYAWYPLSDTELAN